MELSPKHQLLSSNANFELPWNSMQFTTHFGFTSAPTVISCPIAIWAVSQLDGTNCHDARATAAMAHGKTGGCLNMNIEHSAKLGFSFIYMYILHYISCTNTCIMYMHLISIDVACTVYNCFAQISVRFLREYSNTICKQNLHEIWIMMRLNDSYSSAPLLQRRQDPLKGFSKAPDGVVTIPIFVYFLHFIFFSISDLRMFPWQASQHWTQVLFFLASAVTVGPHTTVVDWWRFQSILSCKMVI